MNIKDIEQEFDIRFENNWKEDVVFWKADMKRFLKEKIEQVLDEAIGKRHDKAMYSCEICNIMTPEGEECPYNQKRQELKELKKKYET